MTYYTKELITKPKNMKEGLLNFLQMIINHIEADLHREALLFTVDLKQDIATGIYDTVFDKTEKLTGKTYSEEDLIAACEKAREDGYKDAKTELAIKLGLI